MIQDRFVKVTELDSLQKLRYWICTVARMAKMNLNRQHSKMTARKFEMLDTSNADVFVKDRVPKEFLVLKLGQKRANTVYRRDTFAIVKELLSEFENACWNSSESECYEENMGDLFPSRITRPHELDIELLNKCTADISKIKSFREVAEEAMDSERLKALRYFDRKTFKAFNEHEVQRITLTMESMGICNEITKKAWEVSERYLEQPNMRERTCHLADRIRDLVVAPEIFSRYIAEKYHLRRRSLWQEITQGQQSQSDVHALLKTKDNVMITRRLWKDRRLPIMQVVHGMMRNEEVGAVVRSCNMYLVDDENDKHEWITEEERKGYLARETVGRMEPGSVCCMESPLKLCWYIFYAIVPIYEELQHDRSIKILEETIKACMDKADALKLTSISIPIWSSPCKKWPSGLAEKVKMSSVMNNIKRAKYISCVRLVAEDDNSLYHGKEIVKCIKFEQ